MKKLFAIMLTVSISLFQIMPVLAEPVFLSDKDMDSVVAGYIEENTLTMTDDSQRDLKALSNVNDVDSAVAAQSNVTFGGFDVESYNSAAVENNDADPGITLLESIESNNSLSLTDFAQAELLALSNVNSVDSANAVQSNITVCSQFPLSENKADVVNIDADSEEEIDAINTLSLSGSAQTSLHALSNLNSVDSAVAVQSNANFCGESVVNSNIACVDNFNGDAGDVDTLDDNPHSLSIIDNAQENLAAFSNVNAVDSAVCVQLNTSINIREDATNTNDGYATNNSTHQANYMDRDNDLYIAGNGQAGTSGIVSINAVDSAELAQVNITVFSGTIGVMDTNIVRIVLNDDGVTSGTDWDTDTNTMTLTGNAQQGLIALHNENLVDSAATIEGNYGAFGYNDFRFNEAYLINKDKDSYIYASVNRMDLSENAQKDVQVVSNLNAVDSAPGVQTNITYDAHWAIGENYAEATNNDGTSSYWTDTDNSLTMSGSAQEDLTALTSTNSVDSASMVQTNLFALTASMSTAVNEATILNTDGSANGDSWGITYNVLDLSGDSQRGLVAQSNLNEVDSATLVQTNITAEEEQGTLSVISSSNTADVDNLDIVTEDQNGLRSYNKLTMTDNTQRSLHALSNINSVDSASAVQSNLTVNSSLPPIDSELVGLELTGYAPLAPIQTEIVALELAGFTPGDDIEIAFPMITGIELSDYTEIGDDITSTNIATVDNIDGTAYWMDVPEGEIMNLLKLSGNSQRNLSALSNLNTVDSANAVQINIVYGNGAGIASSNTATVKNDDGSTNFMGSLEDGGVSDDTNRLRLVDNVQRKLEALSNANTVDSATAVQANLAVGVSSSTQTNTADVLNQGRDILGEDMTDPKNRLTLKDNAQRGLTALSNLNSVDSANTVQSNITINNTEGEAGGITNVSVNKTYAAFDIDCRISRERRHAPDIEPCVDISCCPIWYLGIESEPGTRNYGNDAKNTLKLEGEAQMKLTALSNLNAVSSASAVQSNITANKIGTVTGPIENFSLNIASVENITEDGDNTLKLQNKAQKDLLALSNANSVDSANAVQSNISINGSENISINKADVYNSSGDNLWPEKKTDKLTIKNHAQEDLTALSNLNTVSSANAVQSNITANNVTGSALNVSVNIAQVKNARGTGENKLILKNKAQRGLTALSNVNSVESANAVQSNISVTSTEDVEACVSNISANFANVENKDEDENEADKLNTLSLSNHAQQNLMALSNLNTVSSATAVQSNAAVSNAAGINISMNNARVVNSGSFNNISD
ncbi:MAG: hypothetical protein P9L93_05715 [Candidatus Gorgyraea atricola]|nr:hypothetical protein [Candidatus Gorgyraea atricola]